MLSLPNVSFTFYLRSMEHVRRLTAHFTMKIVRSIKICDWNWKTDVLNFVSKQFRQLTDILTEQKIIFESNSTKMSTKKCAKDSQKTVIFSSLTKL